MRMRMCDRFARALPFKRSSGEAASDHCLANADNALEVAAAATLLSGVYSRECSGQSTNLRQVHRVAGLTQSAALNLIARLQDDGMITIISALHDEFESRIELTDKAKRKLSQLVQGPKTPSIRG